MNAKILLALPALSVAAAAHAETGRPVDGLALSGMAMLAVLATALVRAGLREWRRETGRPEPVRMRVRARRYNQP